MAFTSLLLFVSLFVSLGCVSGLKFASVHRGNLKILGMSSISFGGVNHCGILVTNTAASLDFYTNIFGFTDESETRPVTLPYPGAFLRCGTSQIHLMELPNPDAASVRPAYPG